jgi:hypothetical protein
VRFHALNVGQLLKEGFVMVNFCANPGCGKPLHYLRDGRIYVFDASVGTTVPGAKRERRLEHYWLCGPCAQTLLLIQDAQGWVQVMSRQRAIQQEDDDFAPARSERAS